MWHATGMLASGRWWQVCCVDGKSAWVSGELVQPIGPTQKLDMVPVIDTHRWTPQPHDRLVTVKKQFRARAGLCVASREDRAEPNREVTS